MKRFLMMMRKEEKASNTIQENFIRVDMKDFNLV